MSSTAAFLASFASILIGAAIGMTLKRFLSADVLEGGSKEAIRLGAGFLSTLAALVIGLMIASAKTPTTPRTATSGSSVPMSCWSTRCS
jgi:fluoride ion exporter CrcB/FEX